MESNECIKNELLATAISDITYIMEPRYLPEPTIYQLEEVTQSLNFCGAVLYTIDSLSLSFITFDDILRQITVEADQ